MGLCGLDWLFSQKLSQTDCAQLLARKMIDPGFEAPDVVDRIRLIRHCIGLGQAQAKQAMGSRGVVVIGNTGSGKSTFINWLLGCTMRAAVHPQNLGRVITVLPQTEGGTLDEVMPIGHNGMHSETFMPQVAKDPHSSFTFIDTPGFCDDRGPEINIANAVNIKQIVRQCSTVQFVLLISFHSIQADRGESFKAAIKRAETLVSDKKQSIRIGISAAPPGFTVDNLKSMLQQATRACDPVPHFFDRCFIFNPFDTKVAPSREAVMKILQDTAPIPQEGTLFIFQTTLSATDMAFLSRTFRDINSAITDLLQQYKLKAALLTVRALDALRAIEHPEVDANIQDSYTRILDKVRGYKGDFENLCLHKSCVGAQKLFDMFVKAQKHLTEEMKTEVSIPAMRKMLQKAKTTWWDQAQMAARYVAGGALILKVGPPAYRWIKANVTQRSRL